MGEEKEQSIHPNAILSDRRELHGLREILLANVVMAAEIPAPTGGERLCTRFLSDRFREAGLNDIAADHAGNIAAVLPGHNRTRNLLVAAHVDKIWPVSDDHTVSVGVGTMSGRGIADNSLGVAVLATLPLILERLKIRLRSNLILLGTSQSFGRGNLGGMRFFLDHVDKEIAGALCIEGMDLGRLSFSSQGMARGECAVELVGGEPGPDLDCAGVIPILESMIREMLSLNRRDAPGIQILIGNVQSGSGYNVPPSSGVLKFEIRGDDAEAVASVERDVLRIAKRLGEEFQGADVVVEMIAHRRPGDLGADHPLVLAARESLVALGVEPKVKPSISELAALLSKRIPALTLGITRGHHRHSPRESIEVDPIFDGLAQLIAVLQFMDSNEIVFS